MPIGIPGGNQPVDPEQLLAGVEAAIDRLDQLDTADQVAVYDQAHTALAEALARTADTGGRRSRANLVRRARLDAELVRRGLARSREQAAELIAAGRVTISGQVATKSATAVDPGAPLIVRDDVTDDNWASRGAHKLIGALDAFPDIERRRPALPGRRRVDRRVHRCAASPRRARGGRGRCRLRAAGLAAADRRAGAAARPDECPNAHAGRHRRVRSN